MASAVAMMVGGAITNALAFSGSNYLFSQMGKSDDADKEREKHDKTEEQLEAAQDAWNRKRMQRLDFINERTKEEHHALQTFDDADQAMKQYYYVTSKNLPSDLATPLPPEPKLSNFYAPSPDQQNREIIFVVLGMAVTGFIAYKFL